MVLRRFSEFLPEVLFHFALTAKSFPLTLPFSPVSFFLELEMRCRMVDLGLS